MRKPTQIIKIESSVIDGSAVDTVNARDIHKNLEVKKPFADWIKYQIESLDLEENFDYLVFHKKVENPDGGRPLQEYSLSVDAAKHIAMASRTEQGKKVRKYFIAMEKYAQQKMFEESQKAVENILDKKTEHFFKIEKAKISINTLDNFLEILIQSVESREWKTILTNSKSHVKKMIKEVLDNFDELEDEVVKGDEILQEFRLSLEKSER